MSIVGGESLVAGLCALLAQTETGREPQPTPLFDAAVGTGIDLIVWTGLTFFLAGGLLYAAPEGVEATRDRILGRPTVAFVVGVVAFGAVCGMVYAFVFGGVAPLLFAFVLLILLRGVGVLGFFTVGWALKGTRAGALGIGSLLAGIVTAIPVANNIVWFLAGALWTGGIVLRLNESEHK